MIKKEDLHQITEYLWEIPKSFNPKMLVPARFYASQKLLNEILQDKSLEQLVNVCSLKVFKNMVWLCLIFMKVMLRLLEE